MMLDTSGLYGHFTYYFKTIFFSFYCYVCCLVFIHYWLFIVFFHKEEVHLRASIISLKKGDFLFDFLGYPIISLKKRDFL